MITAITLYFGLLNVKHTVHTNPQLAYQSLTEQNTWQAEALKRQLVYLASFSPFYKRLFKQHEVDISTINSLNQLQELPTTSKEDMQLYNMHFLCVPKSEVKEYTATSGTMGTPVTIALTANDLKRLAYNEQQSFTIADGKPDDIYQLMLTLDRQFMAGMAYYMGIQQLGAALVRTGPGLPAMQWDTLQRVGANSLVVVPSFLLKMIEWARQNAIDLKKVPVQKAVCIGENLRNNDLELNALGKRIQEQWPIKLYSTYASTEMQTAFTECSAGQGGHHQPDLIILEVLDDNGLMVRSGEQGEVVVTTLGVEGMPLLRYRTGDVCTYYEEPCSCGRHSRRLGPVVGRKQQMIKYKGTTLYPPAIFDMLNNIEYVKEYVVEVFTNDLGTDELKLHIHTALPVDDCELQLKPLLQGRLRVSPLLHFHSAADIQQMQFPVASRKQVKFIDNRK